jgi:DNA-binding NarL/FixJ family response regulator
MKQRMVIALRATHLRLQLIDALRSNYTIHPASEIEGAVRLVRQHRPHMVLLGVGMRWKEALRVARQIKTEAGEPAIVGLLDPRGRIPNAKEVLAEGMADGVFQSELEPQSVEKFIGQMAAGTPVSIGQAATGLRRWLP